MGINKLCHQLVNLGRGYHPLIRRIYFPIHGVRGCRFLFSVNVALLSVDAAADNVASRHL